VLTSAIYVGECDSTLPGFVVQVGASIICPHGGQVSAITSNAQVLVGGQPVVTVEDEYLIAGCPFVVPVGVPQPCIEAQWVVPASRVLVNGQPVILFDSVGLCLNPEQAPQGPPTVILTQTRVTGT
jgi:hypothetical protein